MKRKMCGFEEAHEHPEVSLEFCRHLCEKHADTVADSGDAATVFVQWYLEPAHPLDFPQNLFHEDFVEMPLSQGWAWHDPFGDSSSVVQKGLEIHAANGRYLWEHINRSAPRLLRPVSGDFAAQTVCTPSAPPQAGGSFGPESSLSPLKVTPMGLGGEGLNAYSRSTLLVSTT